MKLPIRVVVRLGVKAISFNHSWSISKHGDTPIELRTSEDRAEFISRNDGLDLYDVELKMTRSEGDFIGHNNPHSGVYAIITNRLVGRPAGVIIPNHAYDTRRLKGFKSEASCGWYYEEEDLSCRIDRHEDSDGMKQFTIWVGIENYHIFENLYFLETLHI